MKIKAYYRLGNSEGSAPCSTIDQAWSFLMKNFFSHKKTGQNDGAWIQVDEKMYQVSESR